MRKFVLFIILSFACIETQAQLAGGFQQMNDGRLYFVLANSSYNNVMVSWWAINDYTKEQRNGSFMLLSGNQSFFGPSTIGWKWIKGERFVAVANGQQYNWTCPYTDSNAGRSNPSFGQSEASRYNGRKCAYVKSNGLYCDCSGCSVGNWDPFTCSKCGHKSNMHTR